MLSLVSLIGAGDRCRECFEFYLIMSFYRSIIKIPLCLQDLGLKCNCELWETRLEELPCVLAYHLV